MIALLNLLPIYPLDGSRILQQILKLRIESSAAVDRIILYCSSFCCFMLAGEAIYHHDTFLFSLAVFSFIIAKWLLTAFEDGSDPCLSTKTSARNRQGRRSKAVYLWIPALLILLSFPDRMATDDYDGDGIELNESSQQRRRPLVSAKEMAAVRPNKRSVKNRKPRKVQSKQKSISQRRFEQSSLMTLPNKLEFQSPKKGRPSQEAAHEFKPHGAYCEAPTRQ
jgi:hypothetical protein